MPRVGFATAVLARYTRKAAFGLPSGVWACACAVLAHVALAWQPVRAEHRIIIAAPQSGHLTNLGREVIIAAELAAADINAAGGVLGEPIALDVRDDGCGATPAAALAGLIAPLAAAANTPSNIVPLRAIIGHPCTPGALAATPIYAARTDAVVFITGVTNPRLTNPRSGPHVFRLAPAETPMGVFLGEHLAAVPPTTRTAVIYDRSIRSLGVIQAAQKTLGTLGRPPVLVENYGSGDKDFGSLAARIAAAGITRIGLAAYPAEAALLIGELRAAVPHIRVTATDTLAGTETSALARAALDGVEIVMQPDARSFPETAALARRLEAKGATASRAALASYTAVHIWASAALGTKSAEPKLIAGQLQTMEFASPLGAVTFNANGDASLPPWAIYTWRKGVLGP
jgi:branched-chain amino acid transport system substrate-binding protein